MNVFDFQEKTSNIQLLEQSLNIFVNESSVQKPHSSIKSLFYNNKPKNRKNLKKLKIKSKQKILNRNNTLPMYKLPSIESIINNSKANEFLSLDHPNNNYLPKIIIPVKIYSNNNPYSSMNKVKMNNGNTLNNTKNNLGKSSQNPGNNNNINSLMNNIQVMKNKKISEVSNGPNLIKKKNINDLYKELLENVR